MYQSITMKKEFEISNFISIHYFEYMSDFSFEGESHDFWELLCVDKGTVNVVADATTFTLNQGDIIFHKPNQFHNVNANGIVAPNLVVISFQCDSPAMQFFEDKILKISNTERSLLAQIIREARQTYGYKLDDPYCEMLIRQDSYPFGSEQLIELHLQELLINLYRTFHKISSTISFPKRTMIHENHENELFTRIVSYMWDHIESALTLDQICKDNLLSRSIIQKLFQENASSGVIAYFANMKIEYAKQLIRNHQLNFSQISYKLGYSSIHYFSRYFKKISGMTPTEYINSIKSLSEQ